MRCIAFDIGQRRVGVATSDALGMVATPLRCYVRGDDPVADARELAALADLHGAEVIVVGNPVSLRGKEELAAEKVREFSDEIGRHAKVPIVLWDERMTTVIAERSMISADVNWSKRREKVDQVAAAVILQSYLDARKQGDDPSVGRP